jgi:UDP-N-acetylglucosamine 2-epimerase
LVTLASSTRQTERIDKEYSKEKVCRQVVELLLWNFGQKKNH